MANDFRWGGPGGFHRNVYRKLLHQVFRVMPSGTNIYEWDWDLLIIVDACRVDLFQEIAPSIDSRFSNPSTLTSVETKTPAWMRKTFTGPYEDEIAKTHYVCGNPFSEENVHPRTFSSLSEIWRTHWDADFGTILPEVVTDHAIAAGREHDDERLLVHYMQPHWPFIGSMGLSEGRGMVMNTESESVKRGEGNDVWGRLRRGEVNLEDVWNGYRENLRYVLEEVVVLLDNVDAEKVIVTSDHGNAKGEWEIYGHPPHMPLSCLRKVPWVEVSAVDNRTREHDVEGKREDTEVSVDERLESLGYR